MTNDIINTITNANQIEAAKALRNAYKDGQVTEGMLIHLATIETRRHVTRAMDSVAKKMGYGNMTELIECDQVEKATKADATPSADPFADAMAQDPKDAPKPKRATIERPDFKTIDWYVTDADGKYVYDDETGAAMANVPTKMKVKPTKANPHVCPKCGETTATTVKQLHKGFGVRQTQRWNVTDGAFLMIIPQSYCRDCRSAHAKTRRLAKQAAEEAKAPKATKAPKKAKATKAKAKAKATPVATANGGLIDLFQAFISPDPGY